MYILIDKFNGVVPGVSPRLLTNEFAQTAENIEFESGVIDPIYVDGASVHTLQGSTYRSIFYYDDTYWLEWAEDGVSVVDSPLANDAYARLYWTGEDYPRVGTVDSMITGSSGYPAASYRLGVPYPEGAPGVAKSGTADDEEVPLEVSYVYTLVTSIGEEGPPSDPSDILSVTSAETVTVTMPSVDVPSGNYQLSTGATKRIYRSNTGSEYTEYQFVAEVPIATTTYADVFADTFLGEVLPSSGWIGPPDDDSSLYPDGPLEGLIFVANGIMAGHTEKSVCFCEPYLPHAWPIDYRYTLDAKIVGIGSTPNGVVALTDGKPYFITGADPSSMTDIRVNFSQACVNARSIVDMGDYILYASPDGLCSIQDNQGAIVTRGLIGVKDWRANWYPEDIRATEHEGCYVAFWKDGFSYGGWVYDPRSDRSTLSTLTASEEVRGTFYDENSGITYKIIDDEIIPHRQHASTRATATWKSKKFIMQSPVSLGWLAVDADGYPVTVKVYVDGTEISDDTISLSGSQLQQTVNSGPTTVNIHEPIIRLPAVVGTVWEVEIITQQVVNRVVLAQTMGELKSV